MKLASLLILLTLVCCNNEITNSNKGKCQIFVIPENHIGVVTIAYGIKGGEKVSYENGCVKYQIPASGVLILNDEVEHSTYDPKYIYSKSGNEIKEKEYREIDDTNEDSIFIFQGGTYGNRSTDNLSYKFETFTIGSMSWIERQNNSFDLQTSEYVDSIINNIYVKKQSK